MFMFSRFVGLAERDEGFAENERLVMINYHYPFVHISVVRNSIF